MASQDVRINLGGVTDFPVLTNLHGLGQSEIWQSGEVLDPAPHNDQVTISFSLLTAGGAAADDTINFFWANSDEAALNKIWDAGIGAAESKIVVATEISDIEDVCDLVFSVRIDGTAQTIKGSFIVFSPGPAWQLLIQVVTAAPAGGLALANNVVRYRLGTPQIQP